jgi:hypothetical protein
MIPQGPSDSLVLGDAVAIGLNTIPPNTRLTVEANLAAKFNNPNYYQTVDFTDSIQDGVDEIAAFTGCIYKSAVLPFTQYTTYYDLLTLLPDYIGVVAMFNSVINRWMYWTSLKKFNQCRIDWDTVYGTPFYWTPINHRYVAIFMKPSVTNYGNLYVFYRAAAPLLTDVTPVPIPDEHMIALENYCETDLWEQAQEFTKAETKFNEYKASLEKLRVLMRNQRNRDRTMSLR